MKIAGGGLLLVGILCLATSMFWTKISGGVPTGGAELREAKSKAFHDLHGAQATKVSDEERQAKIAAISAANEARDKAIKSQARMKLILRIGGVVMALAGVGGLLLSRQE